jgi:hypothetical protein
MDVMSFLINAENLRTLFLFVAVIAGVAWLDRQADKRLHKELNGLGIELRGEISALRGEMKELAAALRAEMDALAASLRGEMDARFVAFHKTLKENDFAHLNETIKALTFTLQKNGILEPVDKEYIDSHLENG